MKQKIKNNPLVRALVMPVMEARGKREYNRYLRSPDSGYLKTLNGIYKGKRCFIIGNGPSLRSEDLERLKGEHTFAMNRIYEIFDRTDWRPTFYVVADPDYLRKNIKDLYQYNFNHMFLAAGEKETFGYPVNKVTRIYSKNKIFRIYQPNAWNDFTAYISVDISDGFSPCYTVTFTSIQLAIYMGFSEIYLLGVDFSYAVTYDAKGEIHVDERINDYFSGKKYPGSLQNYASNLHAFSVAREYCDSHGIKIYNATRGGKLEVFERVDFDELMGEGKKD